MKSYNPGNFKRQCFNSVQTVFKLLPESDPRPYISITCDAKGNPSPQNTSWAPKTLEKKNSPNLWTRVGHLSHCEPWKIAQNEAPPAMVTVHTPEGWEEDIQTTPVVKFHGQQPPDAPGSGRRSGGGGHRESQEIFQFFGHFPAISSHPIAFFHHFWTL